MHKIRPPLAAGRYTRAPARRLPAWRAAGYLPRTTFTTKPTKHPTYVYCFLFKRINGLTNMDEFGTHSVYDILLKHGYNPNYLLVAILILQFPMDRSITNTFLFQELTCDVELQHSEPSKQQPLQFSFTLYDLDGHGRMTKDVS